MSDLDDPYATALLAARLAKATPGAPELVFVHGRSLGQDYVTVWAGAVEPGRRVVALFPEQYDALRRQMAEEGIDG